MGVLKYILLFVGLEILPMIYNELICLFIGTHWVYILFTTQINFSLKNTQFCYHANFPPPRKKLVKDNLLYTIAHMFYNMCKVLMVKQFPFFRVPTYLFLQIVSFPTKPQTVPRKKLFLIHLFTPESSIQV